ncbi:hypothetical protein [Rubritalea sp.]|uniref:hypothetical protein n=1 Tax=Rubritalea sp. TaxID=2109375 RepID=UPI003EF6C92F
MLTSRNLKPVLLAGFYSFLTLYGSANAMSSAELLALQKSSADKQTIAEPSISQFKKAKKKSLLESSAILSNGKYWTLVPKNALLHVPENLRSKVVTSPRGKLISWKDFSAMNPAWLSKEKIDIATAKGSSPINYERFKVMSNRGKIIVAVLGDNPIGVSSSSVQKEVTVSM